MLLIWRRCKNRGQIMKRKFFSFMALFVITGIFAACVSTKHPTHPSLQSSQLPKLIPLRDFLVNLDCTFNYKVSPDGKKLAWVAERNNRMTIHFKNIGDNDVKAISSDTFKHIYSYIWAQDSRRMFLYAHRWGDEIFHIYMIDTKYHLEDAIDLTTALGWKMNDDKSQARLQKMPRSDPENILIIHNARDKRYFDLYRLNLSSYENTLIAENPGNVLSWITDEDGNLRARIRCDTHSGKMVMEEWQPATETWRKHITWGLGEYVRVLDFTLDNKGMWLISNRGRDRTGLVRFNLETDTETLIYEPSDVDLSKAMISFVNKKPMMAISYPDYPKIHFFHPEIEADFMRLMKQKPCGLSILSRDNRERLFTIRVYTDKGDEFYLYNKDDKKMVLLGKDHIKSYAESLSDVEPISFKSRDGLTLHGYLTLPNIDSKKPLPMVLYVHGGPWSRDYWRYNATVQFLANRGYAVLQINYRGSSGYGRSFQEAAMGEFADKMHNDLIDGVQWAIKKGIADPQKIGIFGGSYGGYAVLVGLTFTPDIFACGVDVSGPTNLVTLVRSFPEHWEFGKSLWYKYVGNPAKPEDVKIMEAKSPLFRVEKIKRPLLIVHGQNDPRVKRKDVKKMISSLRKAGKRVEYLEFVYEGHSITQWSSKITFYRKLEDFLAKHLGGRTGGFSFSQWQD